MTEGDYLKNALDWNKAPAWANWLAQDGCGYWHWYTDEPVPSEKWPHWVNPTRATINLAACDSKNMSGWKNTLKRRPAPTEKGEERDD